MARPDDHLMSSHHIILAKITHETGEESVDLEIFVTFNYTPGRPESGPSYYSGGEPAEPAEVEFECADLVGPEGVVVDQAVVDKLSEDWLASDGGYAEACISAGEL